MEFDVTVEIPRGSRNTYAMDRATHRIRLDHTLFTAMRYPADCGFVDGTLGRDGDPLGALVQVGAPTCPGCVIRCRALGMLLVSDEHGRHAKVLCVPAHDARDAALKDIEDVSPFDLREIGHFFTVSRAPEPGGSVRETHWVGRDAAYAEIEASRERAARARP